MNTPAFFLLSALCFCPSTLAQSSDNVPFADFNTWTSRSVRESSIIGSRARTLHSIGHNASPWATSNVEARVAGITKCSNTVFPDTLSPTNLCAKLCTILEKVNAISLIHMQVVASGSIFLGEMIQPITNTRNPHSKMDMGIPFTGRPSHLAFDYRLSVPSPNCMTFANGFSSHALSESDQAEVLLILQQRWEDKNGNLHALRVGTARQRFSSSTTWIHGYRIPILYGDITQHPLYKPYMALLNGTHAYYARNSRHENVPVNEEGWASPNAIPTHIIIMASSGCGTPYQGTIGMTLWIDNLTLIYSQNESSRPTP